MFEIEGKLMRQKVNREDFKIRDFKFKTIQARKPFFLQLIIIKYFF